MRRRLETLALAAALSAAPACSVIFDPSQYRTTDAATGGGMDASTSPEAGADPDAAPDAWAPDAWTPDAWMPDAWSFPCPAAGSLALPTCSAPSGLFYCSAEDGTTRVLAREVAEAMLPDGRAYRLGLLGNAVLVADAPADAIVDHEIVREADTLAVVWAESSPRGALWRQRYSVSESGLDETGAAEDYSVSGLGGPTITDLTMQPGNVDDAWLGYTGGTGGGGVGICAPASGCRQSSLAMRPMAAPVWVANAGADVVAGYRVDIVAEPPALPTYRLELEQVIPPMTGSASQNLFDSAQVTGLRSTAGRLLYTTGAVGVGQFAFETTGSSSLLTVLVGGDRARLTQADGGFLQGEVRVGPEVEVATAFGTCGATCACTGCRGAGAVEAQVTGITDLVDWTFDNVDQYFRVAVFLYGDSAGTNVAAAMWDVRDGVVRVEPLLFASGRGGAMGLGRSIRTVAERSDTRLEVFVSALVRLGGRDQIYLSGFRLERCSS